MESIDYLRVLRTRKWIVIQAVVVVMIGAVIFSFLQPPIYVATTKVAITPSPATALFSSSPMFLEVFGSQSEVSLKTQLQLLQVLPVAEKVVEQLNLSISPETLLAQIKVEQVGETNLVEIQVRDRDPRTARDIANSFSKAAVEWGEECRKQQLEAVTKDIDDRMQETREDIVLLAKKVSQKSGNQSDSEDFKLQLDLATSLYAMLAEKYEQLKISCKMESSNIRMVSPAQIPQSPVQPQPVRNGVLALLVGSMLGTGLAFGAEYMDDTIKNPEDVEKYFALPLLGQIPMENDSRSSKKGKIVSLTHSKSQVAEAYRNLRTSIQYLNFDQSIKSVAFTSAGLREGKTTVVANLAVILARAGARVAVVDADLRGPTVHQYFDTQNLRGLTSVLVGKVTLDHALYNPGIKGLRVLPAGPIPPNPSELLGSERTSEVLKEIKAWADVVLIDTPPSLAVTDCAVLAPKVDGVVLVAAAGEATRGGSKQVKRQLEGIGARLLGVVLNKVEPGRGGYGYYHYYYYGGDEKGKRRKGKRKG